MALKMYSAAMPEMILLFRMVINFWAVQLWENADIIFAVLRKSSDRRLWNILHSITKCFSSSTVLGQKGQKRKALSILRCLPFSIINWWFESLSLVSTMRSSILRISLRYGSIPGHVLRRLYVLSLLSSLWISKRACWWKISFILSNAFSGVLLSFTMNCSLMPMLERVFSILVAHDNFSETAVS